MPWHKKMMGPAGTLGFSIIHPWGPAGVADPGFRGPRVQAALAEPRGHPLTWIATFTIPVLLRLSLPVRASRWLRAVCHQQGNALGPTKNKGRGFCSSVWLPVCRTRIPQVCRNMIFLFVKTSGKGEETPDT